MSTGAASSTRVRDYVASLGVDAYVVGGSVRDELLGLPHDDEDFLVPGVDHAGLRALVEPHGRVDDMEVHGQLVGVRLHPRSKEIRALARSGIEITPPRAERSTGPGHRDFEIVADSTVTIEQDMQRRDFTVNAMARQLSTGELVDPFGGQADLAARRLRVVTDLSFVEDPLRIVRGLRLVSQLGFRLEPETARLMRRDAAGLAHVSAERIGGGLAADGMGELSKLLLGRDPGAALRLGVDLGVLVQLIPELTPAVGYPLGGDRRPLHEHLIDVVERVSASGAPLEVRLAALLHDVGKPDADRTGKDHAGEGARIVDRALARLRFPTRLRQSVTPIVRAHSFRADQAWEGPTVRRFLADHGSVLAERLLELKAADLAAKSVTDAELRGLQALRTGLERERSSPHRIADLAVDGDDLIAAGLQPGPRVGAVLRALLDAVLDDPTRNERKLLLALALAADEVEDRHRR